MQSRIAPARPEDLISVVERLREIEAVSFSTLITEESEKLLMQTFSRSVVVFTGFFDEQPVVVWGLIASGILSDEAQVWMLGSKEIEEHSLVFVRHSNEALNLSLSYFKKLYGSVLADFHCGIKWLEWLGFSVDPPNGLIRRFEWTR